MPFHGSWRQRRWLNLGKSATQTGGEAPPQPITAGYPVTFDVVNGSGIAYDTATSRWTLKARRTYRIDLQVGGQFSGAGGVLDVELYDVTNAALLSASNRAPRIQVLPYNATSSVFRGPASLTAIIQIGSADIQMQAHIVTATSLTGIYRSAQGTFCSVQEL